VGDRVRARALLRGRVQGVGFRYFAADWADRLGLGGYARNLPDGSLEIVAEGGEESVRHFLEIMRRGPRGARVEEVQVSWETPRGDHDFRIRF
jgi:acylphosphatase